MSLIEKAYAQDFNNAIGIKQNSDISIGALVSTVVLWVVYIAGVLAFFYLVYSGILYITAAGNPDQAKKGQQGILNAIIGIIIISLAYVIVRAVGRAPQNNGLGG